MKHLRDVLGMVCAHGLIALLLSACFGDPTPRLKPPAPDDPVTPQRDTETQADTVDSTVPTEPTDTSETEDTADTADTAAPADTCEDGQLNLCSKGCIEPERFADWICDAELNCEEGL